MSKSRSEILRLVNPLAACRGEALPLFEASAPAASPRTPLIFVHGMEYHSKYEIIRDLVAPFEAATGLLSGGAPVDVHVVHWDSRIDPHRLVPVFEGKSLFRISVQASLAAMSIGERFACIERRARSAGAHLSEAILPLVYGMRQPLVVTHSLGALVWCEALKRAAATVGELPRVPGHWWNLQPALRWNAFHPREEYDCVAALYGREAMRDDGATASVWYSRLDLVLGTLWIAAKKTLAMGQIGAGIAPFDAVDTTRLAREAHGQTVLMREQGPWLARVGGLLQESVRSRCG